MIINLEYVLDVYQRVFSGKCMIYICRLNTGKSLSWNTPLKSTQRAWIYRWFIRYTSTFKHCVDRVIYNVYDLMTSLYVFCSVALMRCNYSFSFFFGLVKSCRRAEIWVLTTICNPNVISKYTMFGIIYQFHRFD